MSKRSPVFDKIIAVDTETSGLNRETIDPSIDYQIVSIGLIVADAHTFEPIDKLYLEIQWNEISKWSYEAEKVHGFTTGYLKEHGVPEEEAAAEIGIFIDRHFGIENALNLLGHNVHRFDLPFLKALLAKYGMPFKFAHRHIDSFSLTMPTIGTFDSDSMFSYFGLKDRKTHNSMEDIENTLKVCRLISKMWRQAYGNN